MDIESPFEIAPIDWLIEADAPFQTAANDVDCPWLMVELLAVNEEMVAGATEVVVTAGTVVDVVVKGRVVDVDVDVLVDDVEVALIVGATDVEVVVIAAGS